MVNKKQETREEYVVRIGPLLKELMDKQKANIKEATYDCIQGSDWEAGEIIAKKAISVL